MTDDIVARLREHREDEKKIGNDLLAEVLGDAAYEIERLFPLYERQKARTAEVAQLCKETTDELLADRERWKTIAHCSYCEPQHDYYCTKHRGEEE